MKYTEEEKKAIEFIEDKINENIELIDSENEKNFQIPNKEYDYYCLILGIIEKQQKEIDCLKNHVHYIKCKNCNKEIRTKRSDTKYCSECSKKVSNKNYINNLSEEQKEKRRMKARETMRKIRAGR